MFNFAIPPTLVIRSFTIDQEKNDNPEIEITGRASGFTQWLLTVMKISTLTTFRLKGEELAVVSAGLNGENHTLIPVSAIESTQCGFSKSIGWAMMATIILATGLLSGVMSTFIICLLGAAIGYALYYFSDRMFISVTAGERTVQIRYKKGIVDGEAVDLQRTLEAIGIVNKAVLEKHASESH